MKRLCAALIGLFLPAAALADAAAVRTDCPGDAYTFAEIVPAQRGPVIAVPDTLCAELPGNATRIESLNIYLDQRREQAGQQPDTRPPRTPAQPFGRY
jgi:hypothetical protein